MTPAGAYTLFVAHLMTVADRGQIDLAIKVEGDA